MASLLRAAHAGLAARSVPQQSLLRDSFAALEVCALPRELEVERTLDTAEGIHVLHFGLRSKLFLPLRPGADIGVYTKASFLHAHVAHPQVLERLAKRAQIRSCFLGRAHVGLAHDLDEWNPGPVEIDRGCRGIPIVDRLACVFFHVHARDADRSGSLRGFDLDLSTA